MSFHLIPNWNDRVNEIYEFRTSIFTTHSGKEQRMAERLLPRRTVNFTALLWGSALPAFKALMHSRGASTISIPDPARYAAVLESPVLSGSLEMVVNSWPLWLKENMPLVISSLYDSEFKAGQEVVIAGSFDLGFDPDHFDVDSKTKIDVSAPFSKSWPAGSVVRPVITGRLKQEVKLTFQNDSVADAEISLSILPGSDTAGFVPFEFEIFDGRPVFLTSPDWSTSPSVSHSTPFEEVDYGRGTTQAYLPIEFYTRISQFDFVGKSRQEIHEILSLFIEMRGRQGEFYCPSWTTDMIAVGGISSGTNVLTVESSLIADTFNGSTVNKAVAILLNDGRWIFRSVVEIISTTASGPGAFTIAYDEGFDSPSVNGLFSRLVFDAVVSEDVPEQAIAMVSWLNVCRFASDTLNIGWITDDVAQTTLQIMTLEALPVEV